MAPLQLTSEKTKERHILYWTHFIKFYSLFQSKYTQQTDSVDSLQVQLGLPT